MKFLANATSGAYMSKAPPVSTLSNILHYCELSGLFTSELYIIIFISIISLVNNAF